MAAVPEAPSTVQRVRAWLQRSYAGQCLERVILLQPIDRALAIASRAFVALLPLAIVATSISPAARDGGFAQGLIDRFELEGPGATAVRQLFATPAEVRGGVTILGLIVLIYSVLGFARLLTRLYEAAWGLPPSGIKGLTRGLLWIAAAAGYIAFLLPLRHTVEVHTDRAVSLSVVVVTLAGCWLLTPYLLLAGRIPFRSLLPTAMLTASGMAIASSFSTYYMPDAMTSSAQRYGLVGVAFSIVSWLTGIGVIILVAAAIGAVTAERWLPPPAVPQGETPVPPAPLLRRAPEPSPVRTPRR
jgi:membrane protein